MTKLKNRRTLYKVSVLVFCFYLLLTGCVGNNYKLQDESNPEAASQQEGQALSPYEIKWYMPNSIQPDMDLINTEMSKITSQKINATLKVSYIDWGSYDQRIRVKMAVGEPMDLLFTSNWTNDYITGVNKGAYLEINQDKLKNLAPNVLAGVPEKCWPAAYVKGRLYAIINTQIEGRTPGILGYKKYFDKYGFDIAKMSKMEDLTPFLEKLKAGEPGIIPIGIDGTNTAFNDISLIYGMEVFSKDNPAALYIHDQSTEVMNYFAAPETKAYLKLVHDWYKRGYIRSDAITVKDHLADLKAGKIALMTNVLNPDTMANQAALWGVTSPEMVGSTFMKTFMGTGGVLAALTAISRTSQDPDRCYMLYNLLYDKNDTELFNMLNYGIENVHYTKKNDAVSQIPNSGYWVSCGWENGSMFNSYRQSESQPEWYPIGPEMNENAQTSKVLGFSFNPEPVKAELTQCSSVVYEYYNALFTGSLDPDRYLPVFLEKLNKAGAEKVIEEMQKQINEWKKSK